MPVPAIPELVDLGLKAALAIAGGGWALWHFRHTTARDRVRTTTELFARYNAKDMIAYRAAAWKYAEEKNATDAPFRYSEVWSQTDDRGNIATVEEVVALSQVGGFWAQLHALDTQGLVDRRLAKKLFAYQYHYWRRHLERLVKDTEQLDRDQPEVIEGFRPGRLEWLLEGRQSLPMYRLGVPVPRPTDDA